MAGGIRAQVNREYFAMVAEALGAERCIRIDRLLMEETGDGPFKVWREVKTDSGAPTLDTLRQTIARLRWLESLDVHGAAFFAGVPAAKLARFADEARGLNTQDMWKLRDAKRATLVAAFVKRRIALILDDLGILVVRRIRRMHALARERLREHLWERQVETDRLVETLRQALEIWSATPSEHRLEKLEPVLGTDLERNLDACREHEAHARRNHFPFLWKYHRPQRNLIFEALSAIRLISTITDDPFPRLLEFVQTHRRTKRSDVPPVDPAGNPLPLDWMSERWRKFVVVDSDVVDRRAFELVFLTHLSNGLQNGDFVIVGSDEFSDYRDQLVPIEMVEELAPAYCRQVGLPRSGEQFTADLRQRLAETAETVDLGFPENTEVKLENGLPVLKREGRRQLPADFKRIERRLREIIPRRGILDMVSDVGRWTEFLNGFGLPTGTRASLDDPLRRALFSVFAYGCNLGPSQAAGSLPETSRRDLAYFNQRHVTEQRLDEANRRIIDVYAKLPIHGLWGSGRSASADGTKRELYDNNLLSEYHLRYGGTGAIAYWHVSDTYIAIFSHFIPCSVREAVFILDGLIRNESEIQPDTLHSDTHGQTAAVFAIAHLLGIRLMPRIKNWKDLDFCRPEAAAWYNHIDSLFCEPASRQ
jgi:hypothetical protein